MTGSIKMNIHHANIFVCLLVVALLRTSEAKAESPTTSPPPSVCENDIPLGLASRGVADWQLTASSTYPEAWVKGCAERNARLYLPNGLAWCAKFKSSSEWLQVDLGVEAVITGIMTQGRGDNSEWVTSFMLSHSMDGSNWDFITDQYGSQKIFEGNSDAFMVKHNYLDNPITARFVKIHTYTWHNHPSLRLELIGCQPCKQLIGVPPYARYSASSSRAKRIQRSCMPEYGHYMSGKAWCAKRQDTHQWLQIDVGPPTKIAGVILRGRGDIKRQQFVTRFKLSYSNDSRRWFIYKDAQPLDPRIFDGNTPQVTERIHYLTSPIIARYIRIHPINWYNRIAMRVGLIGCRPKGPCESGYFKINNESSCVPNLAYKKSAWVRPEKPEGDSDSTTNNNPTLRSKSSSRYQRDASSQMMSDSSQPTPTFSRLPTWSRPSSSGRGASGGVGYSSRMTLNANGDPMALLAVDGLTGDELEEKEVLKMINQSTFSRDRRMMSDEPSSSSRESRPTRDVELPIKLSIAPKVCTKLEYRWPFVELPAWYVDLRQQTEINGVVIYTGRHGRSSLIHPPPPAPNDDSTDKPNSDNLERLSVFVSSQPIGRSPHPTVASASGTSSSASSTDLCGFVTSLNDAIFQPRLHIPCRQPITGRFVYIEAHGVRGRWSPEFSALLCEVLVY